MEMTKELKYNSFGQIIYDSAPDFDFPFRFAGGIYDEDTKLIRFGVRDYDPETVRWTSVEPLGFAGSRNWYVYVGNDGVNFVDLDGRKIKIFRHSNLNKFELYLYLEVLSARSEFFKNIIEELKNSEMIILITDNIKKGGMNKCYAPIDNYIFVNFANTFLYGDGFFMTPLELFGHELVHAWQYTKYLMISKYSAEYDATYHENTIRINRGDWPRDVYGKWRFPW